MRLLVTGKETDNAFAVVGTGGTFDKPIGFHYHKEAHDVFLCLKGKINVWANDTARSLGPGDFASVPPVRAPPQSRASRDLYCIAGHNAPVPNRL
jgi:quercetin dioxygenase-like cupin family protein